MADQEQLALLKQGAAAWNKWRQEHPEKIQYGRPDFSGADLSGANLSGADLGGANLDGAKLNEAKLNGANLLGVFLSDASLIRVDLSGADLRYAALRRSRLAYADLSRADLSYSEFYATELHEANLTGANLTNASLTSVFLTRANFVGAKLNGANLSAASLSGVDFTGADLTGADLSGARLIKTTLRDTILVNCSVYGVSAWDVELEGAKQDNLVITQEGEPVITVDDLEVAQFIYLLLNHKKLRNVLNAVTERGVLLLGRFGGGGLEVLQAIAAKLRDEHYLPIIFDFERPRDRDYTETVKTLASLSHFVIADLSGPSVPKELEAIVPDYKIPFAFICQADAKPFAMSIDLFGYPWVLRPAVLFSTVEDLLAKLSTRVIEPAEEMAEKTRRAKKKTLDELFSSE